MSQKAALSIETARNSDLPGILDILNHYVREDHCTFDTDPWAPADKADWFRQFRAEGPHRLLVGRAEGKLVGYVHSAAWRPKRAYEVTVETTVYVAPGALGQGVGTALLEHLLDALRGTGALRAVAGIAQPNDASNRLHQALGFRPVGTFHRVGRKFGKDWDVAWFERNIEPDDDATTPPGL